MDDTTYTEVEFGPARAKVIKDGFYDRFRANPDLAQVAQNPRAGTVDFFLRFAKQQVPSRIGPVWAPNYYYSASSAQLLFLAPLTRIRRMLPGPLQPLSPVPGHGLIALTFFSYALCDNDPYNEVSVAVVIRRPGARGPHLWELRNAMRSDRFHAHVLALPVDTEIAQVRGVHGYQLPKWLTGIEIGIGDHVHAALAGPGGQPDLTLTAPLPRMDHVPPQSRIGSSIIVNRIDGVWHQATAVTNKLTLGQTTFPHEARLTRAGAPLSQLLDGLGPTRMLRLDVVSNAQIVLHMPVPLAATAAAGWQAVAAGGMSIGHKGTLLAAETLTATAAELFQSPETIDAAKAEFEAGRGAGFGYTALIGDRPPPLDYRASTDS